MACGTHLAAERVPPVAGAGAATAAHPDGYLASKASPLTGLGAVFAAASEAHGRSQGIHDGPWPEAIRAAAKSLGGPMCLGDARVTIPAIRERRAPNGAANDPTGLDGHWPRDVSTYDAALGGDPLAPVFRLAAPPRPTVAGGPGGGRGGVAVRPLELRAGDVVLLADGDGAVSHAGLHLGGGQFAHAPAEGGAVMLSPLDEPAHAAAYAGARRY